MRSAKAWRFVVATISIGAALNLGGCLGDAPPGAATTGQDGGGQGGGVHGDAQAGGNGGTQGTGGAAGKAGNAGSGGNVVGGGGSSGSSDASADGRVTGDGAPPPDGGDAALCTGGVPCDLGVCLVARYECPSGTPVCTKTGDAQNGTPCSLADGGSGVCNTGACAACSNGTDCTPIGTCTRKVIACNSGGAQCTAAGTLRDGTTCGTNQYCNGGVCGACQANKDCAPTTNPCDQGKSACTSGKLSCTDVGTPVANGTPCGDNKVCNAGACVACEENVVCTPANPCHAGLTSCTTGTSVCVDTGSPQKDGTACTGTDKCKSGYACSGGTCTASSAVVCAKLDQCHDVGTCDPITGVCSNPASTNGTTCDDGNACTGSDTCQAGVCTGGSQRACPAAPACNTSAGCDSQTGLCVTTPKPDGTACGVTNSGMVCTAGSCGCAVAGQVPCSGICVDETTDPNHCGGCTTVCTAPKTCVSGGCACPAAKPTYCAGQNACVDTTSDSKNCGACGHDCLGAVCQAGYCQPTTIGSTANSIGVGLAISATNVYFSDGNGGHLYTCPITGCPGAGPTVYFSGLSYATGVAYDAGPKYAYVSDQNQGTVHIVTAANTDIPVSNNGTPQALATDATYLYFADFSGVGRVNKTTGMGGGRVWSASNTYTKGVSIDPATGRVWAAVQGASGQIASCAADGTGCSTWSYNSPLAVYVIKSLPYIVSYSGIVTCPSTSDCSQTATYYSGYSADITSDATNIYWSSASGVVKCAIGGCGGNPTPLTNGSGTYAVDVANDASYVYWLTGTGVVQRVAK